MIRKSAEAQPAPAAFVNGYTDGQAARQGKHVLSAYLRVGIDDYAKGFRAGFYARMAPSGVTELSVRRQVVNL
ncbi:MAG: hypothetical protein IT530_18040 [Burkholderiales bacterium]|nr:hypothetical protein [Burkholderiales bacterium]